MNSKYKEFIIKTILSNTQSASFQRGNVYADNGGLKEREEFQKDFRSKLQALEKEYKNKKTEEEHYKTILHFSQELSGTHKKVLAGETLRIGTAQKAINLYLKFLWCLELIEEPPHCPVDSIVLTEIGSNQKWTKLSKMEEYIEIIENIKKYTSDLSLAQWEYNLWNATTKDTKV